jgi:hypothetical protein
MNFVTETISLQADEKIHKYRQWLVENPNHSFRDMIQHLLDSTEMTKQELVKTKQELVKTKQDMARKDEEMAKTKQDMAKTKQALAAKDEERAKKDQELVKTKQDMAKTTQDMAKTKQALAKTKQALAKTTQDMAKTKQALAKTKQALAKTKQDMATMDQKLTIRSLSSIKFDFPATFDRTASGPHLSKNHPHADILQVDTAKALSSIQNNWLDKEFWETPFVASSNTGDCSSEHTAQRWSVGLLESIVQGLGLERFVGVAEHRSVAGSECDILLVYRALSLPFAVIEVKKPCNTDEQRRFVWSGVEKAKGKVAKKRKGKRVRESRREISNVVAGQVFDAMTALQLYGFPQVCGMITTWNHWRMVGTVADDELNDLDKADENRKIVVEQETGSNVLLKNIRLRFQNTGTLCSEESPEQQKVHYQSQQEKSKRVNKSRVIWASNIVPSFEAITNTHGDLESAIVEQGKKSGSSIVSLVSLFVVKACKTLLDFIQRSHFSTFLHPVTVWSMMPCRILTHNAAVFAFGSITLRQINFDQFSEGSTLHVIRPLGIGAYGNCCFAVSSEGASCCVVKFFHRPACKEVNAQLECLNWNTVYKNKEGFPKCRAVKAAEGYCLVMPYLPPIPKKDRWKMIENNAIQGALEAFCSSGFVHPEIKWRHLGLWRGSVVLLDLGTIQEEGDEEKRTAWCVESMEKLRKRAGSQVRGFQTPRMVGTKHSKITKDRNETKRPKLSKEPKT